MLVAAFTWRRATGQGAVACISGGLATILGLSIAEWSLLAFSTMAIAMLTAMLRKA